MAANSSDTQNPCTTPLMANPSGAPPNFVTREMFQPITIGTITTFMALAVFFVGLRVAGTLRKDCKPFFDDFLCLVALLLAITFGIVEIQITKGETHAWNMNTCQANKIQANRLSSAGLLLYLPTILSTKAVICALYLRIFESIQWIRYATWTILVYYTLLCSSGFFLYLSHYILVKFNDSQAGPVDLRPYIVLQAASTVLVDTLLLALPIRPIMKMQTLSLRKRVSLLAVFLAGFGATICTIILLVYSREYYYPTSERALLNQDWTWTISIMNLIVSIESFMTIILGCVPGVVSTWRTVIRSTWLVSHIRCAFGHSGEASAQKDEMKQDSGTGQGNIDDAFKVRNNDRTLRLEMMSG